MTSSRYDSLIQRFLDAGIEGKQQLLEGEGRALLEPAGEARLREMAEQESRDEVRDELNWHADALAACRAHGTEAIFMWFQSQIHLRELILRFLNADLEEKSRLLHEETGTLLTSEALAHLQAMADQETRDEARHSLRTHIELLKECLAHGVETAFARMQHVHQMIERILRVNLQEKQRILEEQGAILLTPLADAYLHMMADRHTREEDRRLIRAYIALFAECRADGIQAALERVIFQERSIDLVQVVQQLVSATGWLELQHIIESMPDVILSDAMQVELAKAIKWADDEDPERLGQDGRRERLEFILKFRSIRSLLEECRREGIDVALRRRLDAVTVQVDHGTFDENGLQLLIELEGLADEDQTLTRRVSLYERILALVSADDHNEVWAEKQYSYGQVLRRLGQYENDPAHFEKAVKALAVARQAFERLGRENEAQKALIAFSMAVHECRERDIDLFEHGIVAYEDGELPDQVIREISELLSLTSGENPDTRRDSLNRAKAMCDRVLPALISPKHKRLRAEVQSRRGTVFMRLGDLDGDPASFRQAVQSLRAAAEINTSELSPRAWLKTTTNLAMALMRLGDATGVEAYLDEAIELLRNVNSHSAASPLEWPFERINLATALKQLGTRRGGAALGAELVANLQQAIARFATARTSLPEGSPDSLSIQVKEGAARVQLADILDERYDRESVMLAVSHYESARTCLPPEHPLFTPTQANEALARVKLAALGAEPVANLQQAITLCATARTSLVRGDPNYGYAQITEGNAWVRLAELGVKPVANLRKAIARFATARTSLPEGSPDSLSIQVNEGAALVNLAALGVEPVANLQQAITLCATARTSLRQGSHAYSLPRKTKGLPGCS